MRRLRPLRPLEDSRRVIIRKLVRGRPAAPTGAVRVAGRLLMIGGRFVTKAV